MMEVLPTDWSPRKTSLYFARGAREELVLLWRLAEDGREDSISEPVPVATLMLSYF